MAESRKEPAGGAPAERRRYGLFGFSTAPDAGMDDERRKALARWSGILVAVLTVAVVLLMIAAVQSPGLTVTFDTLGGSAVASQSVGYGETVAPPEQTVRPGYVLLGWSTAPDGAPLWDFAADTVTDTLTLYAVWQPV